MANLNVSYEQMETAAGNLRTGQEEIVENLTHLRGLVERLIEDGFTTSSASGAFDAAYKEFDSGANSTIQGIEGMASFLDKAAQALSSTDEELAKALNS